MLYKAIGITEIPAELEQYQMYDFLAYGRKIVLIGVGAMGTVVNIT